jgi:hypothetical protein
LGFTPQVLFGSPLRGLRALSTKRLQKTISCD